MLHAMRSQETDLFCLSTSLMISVIWNLLAVQGHILCHDCSDFRIHVLLQNHHQNTINFVIYMLIKHNKVNMLIEIYHLAPNITTKMRECSKAYPNSIFIHKESPSSNHSQGNQNYPKRSPGRFCLTGSFTCRLRSRVLQQKHVNVE